MDRSFLSCFFALCSMFFFSLTYAFFKASSLYLPNTQIIFIQSFLSFGLIVPFALRKGRSFLKTQKFGKIALRTIFGLLGMLCITAALKTTNLAETVLLNNTAPLFVPLILLIWHKTKISFRLAVSILIGFIGVFIVLRPGFDALQVGLAFAILSGVFSALLLVITRDFASEPFVRILFYYYLLWGLLLLPFVLINWHPMTPDLWVFLGSSGFTSISAQFLFIAAMRYAPPERVAPFIYSGVIFSALIGWVVWKEAIGLFSFLGMLTVCIGGILTMISARKKI